jgi:hypothetical protein
MITLLEIPPIFIIYPGSGQAPEKKTDDEFPPLNDARARTICEISRIHLHEHRSRALCVISER